MEVFGLAGSSNYDKILNCVAHNEYHLEKKGFHLTYCTIFQFFSAMCPNFLAELELYSVEGKCERTLIGSTDLEENLKNWLTLRQRHSLTVGYWNLKKSAEGLQ